MEKTKYLETFLKENPKFDVTAESYRFGLNKKTLFLQESDSMRIAAIYYSVDDIHDTGEPVIKSFIYPSLGDFLSDFTKEQ